MALPDDKAIITALKKHRAYVTPNRVAVLKVLWESGRSISASGIRKLSPVKLDRVSTYRTLQFLLRKGMVHAVPNSTGNLHYILANYFKPVSDKLPGGQLAYFICTSCGHMEMIEQNSQIEIQRLNKHIKNCYIMLEGVCTTCERKEE